VVVGIVGIDPGTGIGPGIEDEGAGVGTTSAIGEGVNRGTAAVGTVATTTGEAADRPGHHAGTGHVNVVGAVAADQLVAGGEVREMIIIEVAGHPDPDPKAKNRVNIKIPHRRIPNPNIQLSQPNRTTHKLRLN